MTHRRMFMKGLFSLVASAAAVSPVYAQPAEVFTATAAVKTAGSSTANADITIVVDRKMSPQEADALVGAFKTGGAPALRKALEGVPPTGSVRLGSGTTTPTRMTVERPTDTGRLLTILADQPILFLGAGLPDAKSRAGHDFTIIDLHVDENGGGSGTLAPAARVSVREGAFVVQDYAPELIQLKAVKKVK